MFEKGLTLSALNRLALWILLLLLTASILLFPVHLTLEYRAIQSTDIFDNLPLFGTLFYVWLLSLLLLIFSGKPKPGLDLEKMALVCISSLVFLAFWVIILPYGRLDFLQNSSVVKTIQEAGMIPVGKLMYLDYPASHLIILSLSDTTGLDIFQTANLFLILNAVIFSSLLYLFFSKLLHNSSIAAFCAILLMLGNQLLARAYTFWPGIISLDLLLALMIVLIRGKGSLLEKPRDRIMALIFLSAATTMYFQTSILFPLILVGIYLTQKGVHQVRLTFTTMALSFVLPLAWLIYWTVITFPKLVNFGDSFIKDLVSGNFLSWIPFLYQANVSEAFPLWANAIRLFWWALIFGLGTVLVLKQLFHRNRLTINERFIAGGLVGVIIFTIGTTLNTPGGERFVHFLQYAGFFTIPALVASSLSTGKRIKRYGFILLVIVYLVISLPTFLVSNNKISTDKVYPHEIAYCKFLERSFGTGEGLTISNPAAGEDYYLPDASLKAGSFWSLTEVEMYWQSKNDALFEFLLARPAGTNVVFIMNDRVKAAVDYTYGIKPTDTHWQQLEQSLQSANIVIDNKSLQGPDRIYDNSYINVYH